MTINNLLYASLFHICSPVFDFCILSLITPWQASLTSNFGLWEVKNSQKNFQKIHNKFSTSANILAPLGDFHKPQRVLMRNS